MDPLVLWLTGALAALGSFCAWLIKTGLAHMERDLEYQRRSAERGVKTAEKAADFAERLDGR